MPWSTARVIWPDPDAFSFSIFQMAAARVHCRRQIRKDARIVWKKHARCVYQPCSQLNIKKRRPERTTTMRLKSHHVDGPLELGRSTLWPATLNSMRDLGLSNIGCLKPFPMINVFKFAGNRAPSMGWLKPSPNVMLLRAHGQATPMTGWLKSLPKVIVLMRPGQQMPRIGWLNRAPNVTERREDDHCNSSMRSLKWSGKVRVVSVDGTTGTSPPPLKV